MTSALSDIPTQQQHTHFPAGQNTALRTCPLHENLEFGFICTDPTRTDNAFKCDLCLIDQILDPKYLLPIFQVQKCSNNTVFYHWPLPEHSELIRKIQALSVRQKTNIKYKENIDKYFKELRIEVLAKIDAVQESMKKQAESLWDFDERILQLYNQVSSKEILKRLVSDTSMEIEELSERVKETTKDVLQHKEQNKTALEASLAELELLESSIDLEGPQKIKLEILSSLSKITMFPIENLRELIVESDQQQDKRQGPANMETVISLASSVLNNTSKEFNERLRQNLLKFSSWINKADLGNIREERKRIDGLAVLDEGEIEEIQGFINAFVESKKKRQQENGQQKKTKVADVVKLIKCKANHISDSAVKSMERMLEGVKRYVETFQIEALHKDGYQQEEFSELNDSEVRRIGEVAQEIKELLKEGELNQQQLQEMVGVGKQIIQMRNHPQQQNNRQSLTIEGIVDLVGNESNLCSRNYLEKLSQALKGVKFYLESFCVADISAQRMVWKGLEREQLMNLGKLGNKIRELNEKHGQDYKNSKQPKMQQQDNSTIVCQTIRKDISGLKEAEYQEVEQLLSNLPVFELTQSRWDGRSIKWRWMLTKFNNSSGLKLEEEQNGVKVIQKTKLVGSAVCDSVLDNSLVYSVACTFNKPILNNQLIQIGLIPENKIDIEFVGYPNYRINFYSSTSIGSDYDSIKGQVLSNSPICNSLTTIHFRFCIETQSFYFADQSHNNITKVKANNINKNEKYRFGISFERTEDDYWFRFYDVMTFKNQSLVDKF